MRCWLLCLLTALAIGCSKSESKPADPAPKGQRARGKAPAAANAEAEEPANLKALRARQSAQGGPVHYKHFAKLLRDELGPFRAATALEGENEEIAEGVVLVTGTRQYRDGERLLIVTIADTFTHQLAPRLKGEKPARDEPALGVVKSGKVGKYPAVFSWHQPSGESQTFVLVDERVVDVRIVGAKGADDSIEVANLLSLDVLPTLVPEKQ
jgi:hypothetical protein